MRRASTSTRRWPGVPVLREAIAAKIEGALRARYDPASEITVTAGATQAILTAILAIVHPGDEVIVLALLRQLRPNIELAGGRAVRVPLRPGSFRPDFGRIAAAHHAAHARHHRQLAAQPERHRLGAPDMQRLADLLRDRRDLRDRRRGLRAHGLRRRARTPAWRAIPAGARAFIVSSFGKTYHVTGWKVGYVGRPALTAEFRKVHQFNVFTVNTPMQHGLAAFMADASPTSACRRSTSASATCSAPAWLAPARACCPARAAISSAWTTRRSARSPRRLLPWLTREVGVAAIPLSAFYQGGFEQRIVRFCFAKKDETLARRAAAPGGAEPASARSAARSVALGPGRPAP